MNNCDAEIKDYPLRFYVLTNTTHIRRGNQLARHVVVAVQKAEAMDLQICEWVCVSCRTSHDKDINAGRNILNTGMKDLYSLTSAELVDYRRREAVSPEVEIPMASSMKRLADLYRSA